MSDDVSDDVYLLQRKKEMRGHIRDSELIESFEHGQKQLDEALNAYYRQLSHLQKNIHKALSDRETNSAVLTRRYVGLINRVHAIDDTVFSIRRGYATIWEALELALEDAPLRAVSERSRKGYLAKIANNPEAKGKAQAMIDIKGAWQQMCTNGPHMSDAAFARKMHLKHGEVLASDGSIKNAISRWRKAQASSC